MVIKNNRWKDICIKYMLVHSPSTIQLNTITSIFIGNAVSTPITLIF
jgi:hypothetical protein